MANNKFNLAMKDCNFQIANSSLEEHIEHHDEAIITGITLRTKSRKKIDALNAQINQWQTLRRECAITNDLDKKIADALDEIQAEKTALSESLKREITFEYNTADLQLGDALARSMNVEETKCAIRTWAANYDLKTSVAFCETVDHWVVGARNAAASKTVLNGEMISAKTAKASLKMFYRFLSDLRRFDLNRCSGLNFDGTIRDYYQSIEDEKARKKAAREARKAEKAKKTEKVNGLTYEKGADVMPANDDTKTEKVNNQ